MPSGLSGIDVLLSNASQSPDDLTKIPALRKKLAKEQASLEAKLKSGAKDQLEATREGLLKLQATRKDVAAVREAFGEIERLCGDAGEDGQRVEDDAATGTKSFRKISQVSGS